MTGLLQDLVVVFLIALVVVLVLRRIKVPAIAGFILAGMLAGPYVLNIVGDVHEVEVLAEIGVALLLFGIGLELSLDRMRLLWRLIIFGGAIQVGTTVLAAAVISRVFGLAWGPSVFVGCVVAVSSTAIVLSGLRARGELDAPHGRLTIGILVFQDLCVVPMILIIPLLGGSAGSGASMMMTLLKSAALLAAVLVAARLAVPHFLHLVAMTRQRDLFVLSVFLVCIGTAWVVSMTGVSIALGAFLGGLVVAGSEYRHQALSELIPFREVFSSLFFVSVGMLLDPLAIAGNAVPVLALLVSIVLGKYLIVLGTGLVLHLPLRVSVMAAAALAQVGEFSFVLLTAAAGLQVLSAGVVSNLSVAIILSMLITPMFMAIAPRLAAGVGRVRVVTRSLRVRTPEDLRAEAAQLRDHVIIAGFGLTGQELAVSLEHTGVPYVIVDMNADAVRRATERGEPICFGDVTSAEVLHRLGLEEAREFVIAINDPSAAEHALKVARSISTTVPIIVRVPYVLDFERLLKAGATDVVIAELEASAAMTERLLARHKIRAAAVEPELVRIRERRSDDTERP